VTRPTWDETWMNIAIAMSKRSRCVNRQVGAVIVTKENRPMAVGYNGPPANWNGAQEETTVRVHFGTDYTEEVTTKKSSCSEFCPRGGSDDRGTNYSNCISVHAEANALLFADRRDYEGGTIYVTNPCCWDCAKLVGNSGVARVVVQVSEVDEHYDNDSSLNFIRSCGIKVETIFL
jgi:dCMP deaminase